jgi:Glycosyltransferase family 87
MSFAERSSRERLLELVTVFWSVLLMMYSYLCGILFDHKHYVEQWQLMLAGGDPWSTDNTYGPLHNVVGFLYLAHPLAPKLFMVGALLIANALLVRAILNERGETPFFVVYALAVPVNVLTLGIGIAFGLNDDLVAALLVFAVLARLKRWDIVAGLCLALAGLMKFYPILLVPFFMLDDARRLRWRLGVTAGFLFCGGLAAALYIWGPGLLTAMANGAQRGASLMSILVDLGRHFGDAAWLVWLSNNNALCVVAVVTAVFVLAFWRRWSWLEAAVLGYFALLVTYKVGHQQFYLGWLFMVAGLPLLARPSADRLAIGLLPMVVYLSVFHFAFDLGTNLLGNRPEWIELRAGFVSFPIEIATLALAMALIWNSYRRPHITA